MNDQDVGQVIGEALVEQQAEQLKAEIEERLFALARIGLEPEEVVAFVERIAERMRAELEGA